MTGRRCSEVLNLRLDCLGRCVDISHIWIPAVGKDLDDEWCHAWGRSGGVNPFVCHLVPTNSSSAASLGDNGAWPGVDEEADISRRWTGAMWRAASSVLLLAAHHIRWDEPAAQAVTGEN